jgi:hypothetical protein
MTGSETDSQCSGLDPRRFAYVALLESFCLAIRSFSKLDNVSSFIFYMRDRCLPVSIAIFNNSNSSGKLYQFNIVGSFPLAMGERDTHAFEQSLLFPDGFAGRQWCPRSLFRRKQAKRVCHLMAYVNILVFKAVCITGLKWTCCRAILQSPSIRVGLEATAEDICRAKLLPSAIPASCFYPNIAYSKMQFVFKLCLNLLLIILSSRVSGKGHTHPNILFILTDDQGISSDS